MNTDVYDIEYIKTILNQKLQEHEFTQGWLIGSYARGEALPTSDIDLLFKIDKSMSLLEWEEVENDIRSSLNKEIDFIEMGSFSPRVEREIQKEMIILYDKTR